MDRNDRYHQDGDRRGPPRSISMGNRIAPLATKRGKRIPKERKPSLSSECKYLVYLTCFPGYWEIRTKISSQRSGSENRPSMHSSALCRCPTPGIKQASDHINQQNRHSSGPRILNVVGGRGKPPHNLGPDPAVGDIYKWCADNGPIGKPPTGCTPPPTTTPP